MTDRSIPSMRPRSLRTGVLLASGFALALVLLVALSGPVLGAATGVNQLPIAEATEDAGLEDPEAEAWEEVDSETVVLSSADSGLPGADDTSVGLADVETAYTDERIHIRVTWDDAEPAEDVTDPREFPDAVAVQFPLEQEAEPAIAMGSEDEPVNVWYWNADDGVEELYAGGMGSTTEMEDSAVSAEATHTGDEWQVVFTRELEADERQRTDFATDQRLNVAFAVFDGTNQERAGVKAASEWHHYPLDPEAGPSTMEMLLWTVAGIAIATVLVMAVYGVRNVES